MTDLATRFPEFFEAIHGCRPFPWQAALAERVLGARVHGPCWPECIAVATGSGKTSVIDVALFALACDAGLAAEQRTAPRRIVFVVDRRVVVDEAYEHARRLASRLDEAQDGSLLDVADALRSLAGGRSPVPLGVHLLRGGVYRDDAWARTPTQPCVVCTTVDQIGSRLLFRSYGASSRSWPVHAGLAANDSLIVLDEAHCSLPFLQTMRAVKRFRDPARWAERVVPAPFECVVMSATPPRDVDAENVHRTTDADRVDPCLGRRLAARKPTSLKVAAKARGRHALEELARTLLEAAVGLVGEGRLAVAIVVNRVFTARRLYRLLERVQGLRAGQAEVDASDDDKWLRKAVKDLGEFDLALLTGRMRPIDRDRVVGEWLTQLSPSARRDRPLERPVFVVATQCLEVGANLDFDAMATECASLDALRQRFGRLNRTARDVSARGAVVIRADQASAGDEDQVYGPRIAATWDWLNRHAENDEIDFGIDSMEARWNATSEVDRIQVVQSMRDAPVMLPSHVDCWVQTAPEPKPSPDVALFLHGPEEGSPEVRVCWRGDLGQPGASVDPERMIDAVAICPPTSAECLPVPLRLVQAWWRNQSAGPARDVADVDCPSIKDESGEVPAEPTPLVVWRGPQRSSVVRRPDDWRAVRNGDVLVIPAQATGWDEFGHVPDASVAAIDVGDQCQMAAGRRPVLRLWRERIEGWSATDETARKALAKMVEDPDAEFDAVAACGLLRSIAEANPSLGWILEALNEGCGTRATVPHPVQGVVLVGPRPRRSDSGWNRASSAESETTDDDSSCESREVPLAEHSERVAGYVRRFCDTLRLPPGLSGDLVLAARLHDVGKADRRFQAWLHGGNPWIAAANGRLLAKSSGVSPSPRERERARRRADVPSGFRHESLSVQIAERMPQLLKDARDADLVLYLIGVHHGRGRPFADIVDDPEPPSLQFTLPFAEFDAPARERREEWIPPHRTDSGVSERFWRLVRRYGWWSLAYLEAILRLADHRASESESRRDLSPALVPESVS